MSKKNITKAIAEAAAESKKRTIIATASTGVASLLAAGGSYLLGRLANNQTTEKITDIDSRLTTAENNINTVVGTVTEIKDTICEVTKSPYIIDGFTAVDLFEARRLKKSGVPIYVFDATTKSMAPTDHLFIEIAHYVQVGQAPQNTQQQNTQQQNQQPQNTQQQNQQPQNTQPQNTQPQNTQQQNQQPQNTQQQNQQPQNTQQQKKN